MAGRWRPETAQIARHHAVLAVAVALAPAPASAARFDIAPGPLGLVATRLAIAARATITLADPAMAVLASPGVRGSHDLRGALALALRGTGASARFFDARTVRLERIPAAPAPPPAPPVAVAEPLADIVVTAAKQAQTLTRYPGTVILFDPGLARTAAGSAGGTAALVRTLPTLSSTNLGPGRNKLFIRGIADSSFTGPTQATAGQYLGDVRLNYNAPDPNLNLYDMKRVEVLVGPQGTLYGASSLGGILRLVPNEPDRERAEGSAAIGRSITRFGAPGGDVAGMVNVPLVEGRAAARIVLFAARDAGYIDTPSRRDVNRTDSSGQRLTLRLGTAEKWTVDLGLVRQTSRSRDGQYTLAGDAPLTRDTAVPQPFSNRYDLLSLAARRRFDSTELVTTTSLVSQRQHSVFDATGHDGTRVPARFDERDFVTLLAHETRLQGNSAREPWVIGGATIFNASALTRSLGPVGGQAETSGVLNTQFEAALFGQRTWAAGRQFDILAGARLTFARGEGNPVIGRAVSEDGVDRKSLRLSTTLGLTWHPRPDVTAYARYQQGYRAGGLSIATGETGLVAQRYKADDLAMEEIGLRLGDQARGPLWLRVALFTADWNFIQADLIGTDGLVYTANVGRGRIRGVEGEIAWRLPRGISVSASGFANDSALVAPASGFEAARGVTLPNVAPIGYRAKIGWSGRLLGLDVAADASLRRVGRSRLALTAPLDVGQGGYTLAALSLRATRGAATLSLDLDNLADVRGNSFAYGNPFRIAQGNQITPLRPRTLRIGLDAAF